MHDTAPEFLVQVAQGHMIGRIDNRVGREIGQSCIMPGPGTEVLHHLRCSSTSIFWNVLSSNVMAVLMRLSHVVTD
jgi:hypothetical protein